MTSSLESITFRNYRSYGSSGSTLPLTNQFTGVVGVNNTGKTTLLRSFWELRPIYEEIANWMANRNDIIQLLNGQLGLKPQILNGERIPPSNDEQSVPRIRVNFKVEDGSQDDIEFVDIVLERDGRTRLEMKLVGGVTIANPRSVQPTSDQGIVKLAIDTDEGTKVLVNWNPAREAFRVLANSFYVGAFRNAVNSGDAQLYDMQVGLGFIAAFDVFQNGNNPLQNEAANQMSRELGEIFGLSNFQVNVAASKDHLTYFADGKSYRQSELGAGIMQFVMVAVNVLVKNPCILLIDEPELNLHASLQSRFLALLGKYTSETIIYSTHSLGLARSTADEVLVSTRSARNQNELKPYLAVQNLSFVLGELGYGGLHDTAFRALLLVEGVTEVRALQCLLSKYGVRNEVVVVPLGGDSLVNGNRGQELAEVRRLARRVFAIVDSERSEASSEPKRERLEFAEDCQHQNIECLVLQRRAFENYLDYDVARDVYRKPDAPDFGEYGRADDSWGWDKNRNWRIVDSMKRSHFEETDLGRFILRIVESISIEEGSTEG